MSLCLWMILEIMEILIYELSFKEAINSKPPIISDYKIITFGITNPEIEKLLKTINI